MNEHHGTEDEALRRLFDDAVAGVEPTDSLDSIRARTGGTSFRSRRPWLLGAGAAVVATAATVAAVAALGGGPGTTQAEDPGFAGSPTVAASEAGSPTPETTAAAPDPSESASTDEPAATTAVTVPVYYVGKTTHGLRLFREFHRVQGSDADPGVAIEAAVNEAISTPPLDDDYFVVWPEGTTAEIGYDGSGEHGSWSIRLRNPDVDLTQRPSTRTAEGAELALQQLVYTIQGAAQDEHRSPVQFVVEGPTGSDTVLGVPAKDPIPQGDFLSTLSLVMVTSPEQGEEVSGSFRAEGIASSFEANVPWQIRQGDTVVMEGFSMAEGWMDKLYPWKTDPIDVSHLEPGRYTFVAMTDDPSGGAEGNGPFVDSKDIIVE